MSYVIHNKNPSNCLRRRICELHIVKEPQHDNPANGKKEMVLQCLIMCTKFNNYITCQKASRIQASPWCELGGRSTLPEKYIFIFGWYEFGSKVDSHQLLISPHYLSSKALQLWLSALLLVQTLPVEHLEIISLELCWWRTWPFQAHLVHMCTTGCNERVCTFYT